MSDSEQNQPQMALSHDDLIGAAAADLAGVIYDWAARYHINNYEMMGILMVIMLTSHQSSWQQAHESAKQLTEAAVASMDKDAKPN